MAQPPSNPNPPQPASPFRPGSLDPATSPWYTHPRAQDLMGKVAVVTGASRGIGRAIAFQLVSRGAHVLIMCSKDKTKDRLESLIQQVRLAPWPGAPQAAARMIILAADILDPDTPNRIVYMLTHHLPGYVDIFINNACVPSSMEIGELTDKHIQDNLRGNIEFPVQAVEKLVQKKMFRFGSRIICISSVRARKAWANQIMYMATKSANEAMCRAWADAFGGKIEKYGFMTGTTANTVMAGLTRTDSVFANPQVPSDVLNGFVKEFMPEQAIPRIALPEDIADVVGLLCREESRWITGCVIGADGGGISIL